MSIPSRALWMAALASAAVAAGAGVWLLRSFDPNAAGSPFPPCMFRAFTGEFPYGNPDAVSRPRLERPKELSALRPDLPAWLQAAIGRAIAAVPSERFSDAIEFAHEMEAGPAGAAPSARRPPTLYQRHPLRFWQVVAALLGLGLLASLWWR